MHPFPLVALETRSWCLVVATGKLFLFLFCFARSHELRPFSFLLSALFFFFLTMMSAITNAQLNLSHLFNCPIFFSFSAMFAFGT